MNLVIQHSIWAMNASRMLGINDRKITKSGEKLSSGYKINRASDDAAGLSISEKMRKKIRGLEKGMENVEDGISLCQVADGALNEVTDLFQRARELTIKAYNGTNSKDDRQIIQNEIEQCLKEADRIFETTKFNEIPVFHNGQEVHGTYLDTTPYTVMDHAVVYRDMPSWLKINDATVVPGTYPQIVEHSGYRGITQDTNGIMKKDFLLSNGSYVSLYFGPDKGGDVGGYQWVGDFVKHNMGHELLQPGQDLYNYIYATDGSGNYKHLDSSGNYLGWTPTVTDNVSAKLDFSELKGKTDPKDLYNALSDLVGVELAFPCGTCARMEAIRFSGEFQGVNNIVFYDQGNYWSVDTIDLNKKSFNWDGKTYNGYFDAITDIMAMDDTNPDKVTKSLALSDEIARNLASSTYDLLKHEMSSHYDRATMDLADPYSVYIYDYRDTDAVRPDTTMSDIRTYSKVAFDYERVITTGREVEYDRWDEGQIWIQASDGTPDGMFIKSGYLSLKKLGLERYTVNDYRYEVTMMDPDGYARQLEEWYKAAPEPTPVRSTIKVPIIDRDTYVPADTKVIYEDGEKKQVTLRPAVINYKTVDREIINYVYSNDTRGPKPVPDYDVTEIYTPTDLSILDDALAEINRVRSYYGASQNRLEHTYKNNSNVHENLTYAESRIRDTDMADEMVNNSMLNILKQAGLSMLSQANQANQGVLSLLQG